MNTDAVVARIRRRLADLRESEIEQGRDLLRAKAALPPSLFDEWVRLETGLDRVHAERMMRLAKETPA